MSEFKTTPRPYQLEIYQETKDIPYWALFMEQGTGKSKITIDTTAHLYRKDEVKNLIVVAPSGVHFNWVHDEIPKHLPDDIPHKAIAYQAKRADTLKHTRKLDEVIRYNGLSVLCMSYDGFNTVAGKKAAWSLMKREQLLYVLDESTHIKQPPGRKTGKRTKVFLDSAPYAKYRRILSGTPIANSPLDIWTQIQFVDPTFWHKHRLSSYYVFKHYFGIIRSKKANLGHSFEQVVGYRNLEELHDMLKTISSRVKKEDVLKDLPPKMFQTIYFEMNPKQQELYDQLEEEAWIWLSNQRALTAELAITKQLRLQQVTCGYVPIPEHMLNENEEPYFDIPGGNPRLEAVLEVARNTQTQGIIWARFRRDLDLLCEALKEETCVRYDGTVPEDDREKARKTFKRGHAKWFIANPSVGSEGLTLTEAKTVLYYNNSFKLKDRLQSEDRAHRIGQDTKVAYYDFVAKDSIDENIVDSLVKKRQYSNTILGDQAVDWIQKTWQTKNKEKNTDLLRTALTDALQIFGL